MKIDPKDIHVTDVKNLKFVKKNAGEGVPELVDQIIANKKARLV